MPQQWTLKLFLKLYFSIPEGKKFGLSLHHFDSSNSIGFQFLWKSEKKLILINEIKVTFSYAMTKNSSHLAAVKLLFTK